ncbi:MAG: hypothetical protein JWM93_2063 [Frankiales bacterium]|nr:hypothetical protein [Frankiales bacterium]
MTDACADCAAPLVEGATWCLACQVPVRPDVLVAEARAHDRATKVVPEFSRTKAGDLSFGLTGRIVVSALTLGVFWWLLITAAPFSIIWLCIAVPVVLKDTWKRARIK